MDNAVEPIGRMTPYGAEHLGILVLTVVLAAAVCYFWGLTLNLQSIITPDLNYFDYPMLEFVIYWFLHIVAFVVPVLFIWGLASQSLLTQ